MLQNAYLLAKIGADTAENEQHFAKNLRKTDNYPTGPERVHDRRGLRGGREGGACRRSRRAAPSPRPQPSTNLMLKLLLVSAVARSREADALREVVNNSSVH